MGMVTAQDWLDAQYAVLGSVLISPEIAPKVIEGTDEGDYSGQCRTIYAAIRDLFLSGKPADPVLVQDKVGASYASFLLQLMEITPTAANVDQYISLTRKRGQILRLREIGEKLQCLDATEAAEPLLSEANGILIQRTKRQPVTMEIALEQFYARHTGTREYLKWPIPGFDKMLFVEAGDYIVIGGRPSAGKSALALQFARYMAKTKRVGFFSLETSADKLMDRMISSLCSIDMGRLKRNEMQEDDWNNVAYTSSDILSIQLEWVPAANMTVPEIRARTFANRYDIIIIDYLQLIRSNGISRYEKATNISIDLHTMAQNTGTTIIALSQLSRGDKSSPGAPSMSDLRESGQIEQDADVIFMLSEMDADRDSSCNRKLSIVKNKEGETGHVYLRFNGATQTFARVQAPEKTQGKTRRAGLYPYEKLPDDAYIPEQFLEEGRP